MRIGFLKMIIAGAFEIALLAGCGGNGSGANSSSGASDVSSGGGADSSGGTSDVATLHISVATPPTGTVASPYPGFTFSATGGSAPYTWTSTGPMPPGLQLKANGTVSGTPTQAGIYDFTVTVTDSAHASASTSPLAQITINSQYPSGPVASLVVSPASIPAGQSAMLTWTSSGWPSNGVTTCHAINAWTGTPAISGHTLTAPTMPGTYTYTLDCESVVGNSTTGESLYDGSATATLIVTANGFSTTALTANVTGTAARAVDANLADPWGIALPPMQAAVVANRETNTSTAYDGTGMRQAPVIALPAGSGGGAFGPTGLVVPPIGLFAVISEGKSGSAQLIYAGESGMLAAWAPAVNPANAITVYTASDGAVYRGLAVGGNLLYATDLHNGKVDVFNAAFAKQVRSATSYPFADPGIPPGYAPFGIAVIGNSVYVTYAKRLAPANRDAVSGAGFGLIDAFDLSGNFLRRLIEPGGALNAPWGIAVAPPKNLGEFSSALLVGNTGDGLINAFDPASGKLFGSINGSMGTPVAIPGLHGIAFGNRYANQPTVSLFFTAGADNGASGRYGRIDFGAAPRLHAPPAILVRVVKASCFVWLCGEPPQTHVGFQIFARIGDVSGIARVELDTQFQNPNSEETFISSTEPYGTSYWFSTSPVNLAPTGVSVTATATDVDGNVGVGHPL